MLYPEPNHRPADPELRSSYRASLRMLGHGLSLTLKHSTPHWMCLGARPPGNESRPAFDIATALARTLKTPQQISIDQRPRSAAQPFTAIAERAFGNAELRAQIFHSTQSQHIVCRQIRMNTADHSRPIYQGMQRRTAPSQP